MNFIFNVIFFCVMGIAASALALNTSWGKEGSQQLLKFFRTDQAAVDARQSGQKQRQSDEVSDERSRVLREKLDRQRDDADSAEERLRVMQDRNEAQKARMQAQMDRLRNR